MGAGGRGKPGDGDGRGGLQVDALRDVDGVLLGHGNVLREAAAGLFAQRDVVRTEVFVAVSTVDALPTVDEGEGQYPVPDVDGLDVLAYGRHVAGHVRPAPERVLGHVVVEFPHHEQVEVVQRGGLQVDQHLALPVVRRRYVHPLQVVDRAVVAHAVIAQIDWRRSCDEPLLYDSCITVKRKRALSGVEAIEKRKKMEEKAKKAEAEEEKDGKKPRFRPPKNCGSPTQGIITVHRRGKKRREAAQSRFKSRSRRPRTRRSASASSSRRR